MTDLPRTVRIRSDAPWTTDEDELLRLRLESGRNWREIARLHGREPESIRQRARQLADGQVVWPNTH